MLELLFAATLALECAPAASHSLEASAAAPAPVSAAVRPGAAAQDRPKSSGSQATPAPARLARRFHDHVAYLASDEFEGRGTGAPGGDRAADYIAAQFKAAALEPAGGKGTWFQPFEVTLGQKLSDSASLTIGELPALKLKTDFVPLPFSSSEEFAGSVAFAGYGITNKEAGYDDYAGFNARGKVLLILRYEPHDQDPNAKFGGKSPSSFATFQSKARTAREHGAAALLIVNPPLHHGQEDRLFDFDSVGQIQSLDIPMLHISRDVAGQMLRAAGAKDLATLQNALDTSRKPQSFDLEGFKARGNPGVSREQGVSRNVLGVLPGSGELADEYVVLGAHYDHLGITIPRGSHATASAGGAQPEIHNGADDNASGTAGLILLAGIFADETRKAGDGFARPTPSDARTSNGAAAEKSARKRQLREKTSGNYRSLLFIAFSGEEMGLLGSMHYVNHATVPLENTVAMLNMDMIGRLKNDRLQVFGIKTAPTFETLVSGYAEKFGFDLQTSAGGFGPSDHTAFYGRKIPVLHFFTGIHNDYHRPGDDTGKINTDGAARVIEMIAAITGDLREAPQPPEYVAVAESRPSRTGLNVRMGVMPSYAEDDQPGMQIDGVSPGSPAEKAGIKPGDRLLMLGTTTIQNVYDLMAAMGQYEPGDEAGLTVMRNGEKIQMAVKFEAP